MEQLARNATDESWGNLNQRHYVLHDRDTKFCASFRATLASGGIEPIQLPARGPNLLTRAKPTSFCSRINRQPNAAPDIA